MRESEFKKKKWSTLFTICPSKEHNNKKERLLTSTRKHAQAVFHLFGQVTDVRYFKIPDILWNLQPLFYKWVCLHSTPVAERIAGYIQTACSLFSEGSPVCMWGFAHVCSLRNVVLFFTRQLWLFFEVFSQTPFLTVMKKKKPNVSCFLDYSERTCFVCLLCVVAGVCFVLWGNFGVLIKKAVSLCKLQKHKHMP